MTDRSLTLPKIDVDPLESNVWEQWYSWYQLHYHQFLGLLCGALVVLCGLNLSASCQRKQRPRYGAVKTVFDSDIDIEAKPINNWWRCIVLSFVNHLVSNLSEWDLTTFPASTLMRCHSHIASQFIPRCPSVHAHDHVICCLYGSFSEILALPTTANQNVMFSDLSLCRFPKHRNFHFGANPIDKFQIF